MGMYNIIYADPPWHFSVWNVAKSDRHVSHKYPTMNVEDICKLPIKDIAADNAMLFLWATYPNLLDALKVMKAWKFKYKTVAFTWVKLWPKSRGPIVNLDKDFHMGLGYYTRANPEICLLGTRGKILERLDRSVRNLVITPRGRHSEKPGEVRDRIVQLFGDLPRVELFARQKVSGWDSWGNEVQSDIELEARK